MVWSAAGIAARLPGLVVREVLLSLRFVAYDRFTGWTPPALFTVSVSAYLGLSADRSVIAFAYAVLYFWLYIYAFTLSNQLAGIDEDALNKPDRPLVIGACTPRGAVVRLAVVLVAFQVCGWWLGVLPWAALWGAALLAHNQGGWSRHWLGKDMIMGVATWAQLAAAWEIAGPVDTVGWGWIATLSVVIFLLVPLQDLRDRAGDSRNGRLTLVMRLGERNTRVGLAAGFALLPIGVHFALYAHAPARGPVDWSVEAALAGLSLLIAARVLTATTSRRDHNTYSLLTYWYTATLAGAFVVLGHPTW